MRCMHSKGFPMCEFSFLLKEFLGRDVGMLITQHSFSTAFCCLCWKMFLFILLLSCLFLTSQKLWQHLYNVNQSFIFFVVGLPASNACEPRLVRILKLELPEHEAECPLSYWVTNEDAITASHFAGWSLLLVVRTSQCFSVIALSSWIVMNVGAGHCKRLWWEWGVPTVTQCAMLVPSAPCPAYLFTVP